MKNRGSAYLYVVLIVAALGGFVLLATAYGVQMRKVVTRRELSTRAEQAFLAVVARYQADRDVKLALPASREETIAGVLCKTTATGLTLAGTKVLRVDCSATVSRQTFKFSTTISDIDTGLGAFALFVNGPISTLKTVTTGAGGANGSVFAGGNVSVPIASSINGNVESTGSILPVGLMLTGLLKEYAEAKPFAIPSASTYQALASETRTSGTLKNYTFPAATGQFKPILYQEGNLDLSGRITGQGTIFVNGNLIYKLPTTYGDANSRVVVIVTGNLTIEGTSIVGPHYVQGTASMTNSTKTSTISGGMAAGSIVIDTPFVISSDPTLIGNPSTLYKFRMPGYWP